MANCFWQRCTCPTAMPCQEHQGIWCGRFRAIVVTDLSQVQNDVVAQALAVTQSLVSRAGDADASAAATEALQRDWERRRADFEQRYPNPDQADEQALRDEVMALAREADDVAKRLKREVEGIRALAQDPEREIDFLTPFLLIPFHDADGYCDCYNRKLAKLSAAAAHLSGAQSALLQATRDINASMRDFVNSFVAFAASIVFLFVVVGIPAIPAVSVFLALLLVLVLLIAVIIEMVRVWRRWAAFYRAKAGLLQARLLYYRLQHISTCQMPFDGWQRAQPPSTEGRTREQQEVDRHLEEQAQESGGN